MYTLLPLLTIDAGKKELSSLRSHRGSGNMIETAVFLGRVLASVLCFILVLCTEDGKS